MGGFLSQLKRIGNDIVDIVASPVRGIGHTGMEIGRGFSRGDVGRIFAAPFKGAGHMVMEQGRGTWDLTKASGSMVYNYSCPASGILAAGAMAPPNPATPFVAAGAATTGVICGIKTNKEITTANKQQIQNQLKGAAASQKKKNQAMYLALSAAAVGVGVLTLT